MRYAVENKKLDEKEATFFERMRLQIMQNIEVTLENIHIGYETKSTTKLGHPFSFGFTLHYLQLTVRMCRIFINKRRMFSLDNSQ